MLSSPFYISSIASSLSLVRSQAMITPCFSALCCQGLSDLACAQLYTTFEASLKRRDVSALSSSFLRLARDDSTCYQQYQAFESQLAAIGCHISDPASTVAVVPSKSVPPVRSVASITPPTSQSLVPIVTSITCTTSAPLVPTVASVTPLTLVASVTLPTSEPSIGSATSQSE